MEQQLKKLRKSIMVTRFVLIAGCLSFAIFHRDMRVVDFIQVLGTGVALGVLIMSSVIYRKLRNMSNNSENLS